MPPRLPGIPLPRPAAPGGHADPGLQPERTVLSWDRTVLALHVTALMFVRWYSEVGVWAFAPAALAALVGAVIMLGQRRRYGRQSSGITVKRVRPAWRTVAGMAAFVVALSCLGLTAMAALLASGAPL